MSDPNEKRSFKERVKSVIPIAASMAVGATIATVCTVKHMNERIPSALIEEVRKYGSTTILLTRSNELIDLALHKG